MARLEIDHVTKRYGDVHAVRDVTLDVADGEFVVLLGPSAAARRRRCASCGLRRADLWRRAAGERDITKLAAWKPATTRSVVVLPQPDGPSKTTNSPSATSRVTSRTA